jgi:NitT/TauT family transport system substrate-binding protein
MLYPPQRLRAAGTVLLLLLLMPTLVATAQPAVFTILAPRSTSSLPLLRLADQDPVPGVDIRTELFVNHAQALAALIRGDVDALLTGTSQGWENFTDGGPLVLVNTGVWGVSYLIGAPGRTTVRGFGDLKGKRIALPFPGAPLDFQTRYLLSKAGLDPEREVEILYSPFGQTVPLLLNGRLDAAALPEPLATSLVEGQGLPRLVDYQQAWAEATGDPRSPQVSLFVTGRTARERGEFLQRFSHQWRSSSEAVVNDPGAAAAAYADSLGMPAALVARAIPYTLFYVPDPEENRRRVERYYELLRAFLPEERPALSSAFFFAP